MHTDGPLVVALIGVPGSGKTSFSLETADRLTAVRVNGDEAKAELFGSVNEANKKDGQQKRRKDQAFGLVYSRAESALASDRNLVCDFNHDKRSARDRVRELASKYGASCWFAWMRTPVETAVARCVSRWQTDPRPDVVYADWDTANRSVLSTLAILEAPTTDENVVILNACLPTHQLVSSFLCGASMRFYA